MRKPSKKQVKEYFECLDEIENIHFGLVSELEKKMQTETGIKDLECVYVDGCIVGIGTPTREKKLKLIHR